MYKSAPLLTHSLALRGLLAILGRVGEVEISIFLINFVKLTFSPTPPTFLWTLPNSPWLGHREHPSTERYSLRKGHPAPKKKSSLATLLPRLRKDSGKALAVHERRKKKLISIIAYGTRQIQGTSTFNATWWGKIKAKKKPGRKVYPF